MRIVSGTHKGRRISAPRNLPIRPTTDMAKEALFNILHNSYQFETLKVLDLFAGSGNISYEFASRGAASVCSLDSHQGCVRFMEQISEQLQLGLRVIRTDAFEFLKKSTASFDLIFADPPYDLPEEQLLRLHSLIFDKTLLANNGLFILEHSKQKDLAHFPFFRQARKYGSTVFSFFEKEME